MSKFYRRRRLQCSAAAAALMALTTPVAVYAQTATYTFNIPAQGLALRYGRLRALQASSWFTAVPQ